MQAGFTSCPFFSFFSARIRLVIPCVENQNLPVSKLVTAAELEKYIRNIPDFPKPGIQFKDITPVLADPRLFAGAIDLLIDGFKPGDVDSVVGIDARGF